MSLGRGEKKLKAINFGISRKLDSKMKQAWVISYLLMGVSLFLWFFSVFYARLEISYGITRLGLVSILPPIFFVSVSLLTVSFLISLKFKQRSKLLLFSQIVMLIFFLNFTPSIIEGTPRFSTTYSNYQSIDYILQKGHLSPSDQWIHNWPGFSIAFYALTRVTALPTQPLLSMYPTLFNTMFLLPLYIFFHSVIGDKEHKWIAIWVFYIFNWIGQDYFSMQSVGFFIFTLMVFIVFKQINSPSYSRRWLIILILLFSFLSFTHMLSSLVVLSIILMFFASKYFRKPLLLSIFALLFVSWTIYGAVIYFEGNLLKFITQALNIVLLFQANIAGRVTGSSARIAVAQIRLLFSLTIVLFAFSGAILSLKQKKFGNEDKRVIFMLLGMFLPLLLFIYGGEIIQRIYLFSLTPLVYFITKGLNSKTFSRIFIIFLILAAPPLYLISHYGNEIMDYVPPSEFKGVQFFYNRTTQGFVIGGFRDFKYRQSYRFFSLSETIWKESVLSLDWIDIKYQNWPRFVCLSYGTRARVSFTRTLGKIGMSRLVEPQFIVKLYHNMTESTHYNKIYSNPSFDVYLELRNSL